MSISLVPSTVTAIYVFDELSKKYTFTLLEKGGPIIISDTIEEGKSEFEKALNLSYAVRNLQYFDDISLRNRAHYEKSRSKSKNKVEYLDLQAA